MQYSEEQSSRYQQPPRKRRAGIPHGWSTPSTDPIARPTQDRLIALFESAIGEPSYDANRQVWDEILATLNLRPCYQPAVARVLSEARWRHAANPRGYVATAAARQALRMRLLDFSDREFRQVPSSDAFDKRPTTRHSMSPPAGRFAEDDEAVSDIIEGASTGGVYERTSTGAMRYVHDDGGDYREIQRWLQRGDEYDSVDCETVAAYATLKPQMVHSLATALILRFERRLGRPAAVAQAKTQKEALEIEAAWKWIDRNLESRLSPLFRMESPPRKLTEGDL